MNTCVKQFQRSTHGAATWQRPDTGANCDVASDAAPRTVRRFFSVTSWLPIQLVLAVALVAGTLGEAHAGAWNAWMNVWDQNPATGGAYMYGQAWGIADLKTVLVNTSGTGTTITDNILELYPNYNAYADNPGNAFWRNNGGAGPGGNKWLEANSYIQTTVTGETAVFSGTVSSFSLAPEFKAEAVIKVFDTGWNYIGAQSVPLTSAGAFSVTMDTLFYPGYYLQKGFMVSGTNANPAAAASNGFLRVITEPSGGSLVLIDVGSGTTRTQAQAGYPSIPTAIAATKTGAGTVVFDAVNAYSGPTGINAGTLRVSNTGGLSASPVTVSSSGTLAIAAAGTTMLASVTVDIGGAMTLRNDVRQNVSLNSLAIDSVVQKTVDSGTMTNGYRNVFNLPADGGNYIYGEAVPIADLQANFTSATSVTLSPCSVSDTSSFWYTPSGQPGATGNKTIEAILYGQADGTLAGKTVKFSGSVPSYSLLSGSGNWTVKAFIRDFASDFSSYTESTVPVTGTGAFAVSLATNSDSTRHVQWGLTTTGPTVWITDLESKGNVVVQAVTASPEGGKVDIGKGRINIAPGGTTEAELRANLIAGRSGGTWSGSSGIVTTGGAAGFATQPVVGYQVFTTGSATVAWAAFGDVNLDGVVNSTDISLINGGGRFNQGAPATWAQGDLNYDGVVNSTDISLLNGSGLYGAGSYLPAASLGMFGESPVGVPVMASVPEPATWALALAGLAGLAAARGRSRGSAAGRRP